MSLVLVFVTLFVVYLMSVSTSDCIELIIFIVEEDYDDHYHHHYHYSPVCVLFSILYCNCNSPMMCIVSNDRMIGK